MQDNLRRLIFMAPNKNRWSPDAAVVTDAMARRGPEVGGGGGVGDLSMLVVLKHKGSDRYLTLSGNLLTGERLQALEHDLPSLHANILNMSSEMKQSESLRSILVDQLQYAVADAPPSSATGVDGMSDQQIRELANRMGIQG